MSKVLKRYNKKLRLRQIRIKEIIKYFEENNLGYDDTFIENYARYRIYKCFDKYYFDNYTLDFDNLLKGLKENTKYLNICYKNLLQFDKDYRSGEESYGYKDLESIIDNLIYVSDRWNCSFRLRWLIDLINKGI